MGLHLATKSRGVYCTYGICVEEVHLMYAMYATIVACFSSKDDSDDDDDDQLYICVCV